MKYQKLPKDIVRPTIVAGVNALGRGQDRESLTHVYWNYCTDIRTRSFNAIYVIL